MLAIRCCAATQAQNRGPMHRKTRLRVSATAETQHLFHTRVSRMGWKPPRPDLKGLHPIAREAWASIHTIYTHVLETPLLAAPWLADLANDCTAHIKLENKQTGGSFKARGAAHKLFNLSDEELQRGVVTASTGNHAVAVLAAARAASAQRGGILVPVRIYLPTTVSTAKVERLKQLGAELVVAGRGYVEAEARARQDATAAGMTYVSAYNDEKVAGGQGSIAIELLMQLPRQKLDTVFVPVGGGGLAASIAAVLKAADPSIHVVGCQPAASDVMRQSVAAGQVVEAPWLPTLSEGTGGGLEPDAITLEPCRRFVDEWVTVDEPEIANAVIETVTHSGMQVEGATGVAVAAFHRLAPQMHGKHCIIIVCGGNISAEGMDEVYRVAGKTRRREPAAAA